MEMAGIMEVRYVKNDVYISSGYRSGIESSAPFGIGVELKAVGISILAPFVF